MTRFVKYIINNLNRKNRVVKFIFRLAITNDNLLGDIFYTSYTSVVVAEILA